MWETILTKATEDGLFALLFVSLLVYTIKRNESREESMRQLNKDREDRYIAREEKYIQREVKYQQLLEAVNATIKNELCDIKNKLDKFIE